MKFSTILSLFVSAGSLTAAMPHELDEVGRSYTHFASTKVIDPAITVVDPGVTVIRTTTANDLNKRYSTFCITRRSAPTPGAGSVDSWPPVCNPIGPPITPATDPDTAVSTDIPEMTILGAHNKKAITSSISHLEISTVPVGTKSLPLSWITFVKETQLPEPSALNEQAVQYTRPCVRPGQPVRQTPRAVGAWPPACTD